MSQRILIPLLALLLALPLSLAASRQLVLAQHPVRPQLFALSSTAFPPHSRVVRAGVETNQALLHQDPAHFGLAPATLGRLTGFAMEVVEGTGTSVSLAYLVSIFHTAHQAHDAFALRWSSWFSQEYYTTPAPPPIAVGERGDAALFHTFPGQPQLAELFFRRGAVLVEVDLATGTVSPTPTQLQALLAVATRLDSLARRHPSGA